MSTLQSIYTQFVKQLCGTFSEREAVQTIEILLEQAGYSKHYLLTKADENIPNEKLSILNEQFNKVLKGMPLSYASGKAYFMNLTLQVTQDVLIPRPETEELVYYAAQEITNRFSSDAQINILDIGTGSGCIPISIKKLFPSANITAIDISSKALEIAKLNAKENESEITFLEIDFLKNSISLQSQSWDVIISNPPYVSPEDKIFMEANVLDYEPHIALFPEDKDILIFYKKIAELSDKSLSEKGFAITEIHENYGSLVEQIFLSKHFTSTRIIKDMQNKDRIVVAIKQHVREEI